MSRRGRVRDDGLVTEEITYENLADHLAHVLPEFIPTIQEHVANNGEVLQRLLVGDLTRFVMAGWEAGGKEVEGRCLSFLEAAITNGDEDVKNLVGGHSLRT